MPAPAGTRISPDPAAMRLTNSSVSGSYRSSVARWASSNSMDRSRITPSNSSRSEVATMSRLIWSTFSSAASCFSR